MAAVYKLIKHHLSISPQLTLTNNPKTLAMASSKLTAFVVVALMLAPSLAQLNNLFYASTCP